MIEMAAYVAASAQAYWLPRLRALDACDEGLAFAAGFDTWQACWDACVRENWMRWAIEKCISDDAEQAVWEATRGRDRHRESYDAWSARMAGIVRSLYPIAP